MLEIYHIDNISVVVDNNVLVDLYELNLIYLLFEIFKSVIIPRHIFEKEVSKEVKESLNGYNFKLEDIK